MATGKWAYLLASGLAGCGSHGGSSHGGAGASASSPSNGKPATSAPANPDGTPLKGVAPLFNLDASGSMPDVYELPFPNDLRVKADGTLDLAAPAGAPSLTSTFVSVYAQDFHGFGIASGFFFRFNDAIDPSSVSGNVYLMSLATGKRVPISCSFGGGKETMGDNGLGCVPVPGFTLTPSTQYAAVVTTGVKAADGSNIVQAPEFGGLAGGDSPAAKLYAPLFARLGADADKVAAAAVYTTGEPAALFSGARAAVLATPAPTAQQLVKISDGSGYTLYGGVFNVPQFQKGTSPFLMTSDGGDIARDASGAWQVQSTASVQFAVSIPTGAMPPNGWPAALYLHGTDGDCTSFDQDGTGARLAAQGLAVLAADAPLNGARAAPNLPADITFFNVQNPSAARANVLQTAAEDFQAVRLMQTLSFSGIKLDPRHLVLFAHSQGSLTGVPFLASEPAIQGAVLSGAGAVFYKSVLEKTEPVDIRALMKDLLQLDEVDDYHPLLQLAQGYLEPADPISFAGQVAKHVYVSQGFVDHYAPDDGIEALALAIGAVPVGDPAHPLPDFQVAGIAAASSASGNHGGKTVVLRQFEAASGSDGHFVDFEVPAAMSETAHFLQAVASGQTPTVSGP